MNIHTKLIKEMIEYEKGCPSRAGHFLKVYGYAGTIGEMEMLDKRTQFILETSALVHDIGIRPSIEKYGSSAGKYQEKEGPLIAQPLLETIGFERPVIDRVCFLIAHHHTYSNIDGLDYQILVEADFLVNAHEEEMTPESMNHVYEKIFRTKSGKQFYRTLYLE